MTVLEGSMEGTRYQGKPRRQWINDIEDWTGYKYIQLKEMSVDREQWRKKTREWSAAVEKRSEEEGRLEREKAVYATTRSRIVTISIRRTLCRTEWVNSELL